MIYEYRDAGGRCIELQFPPGHAPERVAHDGEIYRRVFGAQISADVANRVSGYPYVSSRLPRNLDGCEATPEGKPIVRSRAHEREIMSEHGYERE